MKKFKKLKCKSSYIKYKRKRIVLVYCKYNNFTWQAFNLNSIFYIFINETYSSHEISKILHKAIRHK